MCKCFLLNSARPQMPRGRGCEPPRAWWQGGVLYELDVPFFQDSDADGVGDLAGVLSRIDYIQARPQT